MEKLVEVPRTKTLKPGTMLNRSGHEDDDYLILTEPVKAQVAGPVVREGLPIVVPEISADQTLYLHQPEPETKG